MRIALKVNLLVAALGRERAQELVPEIIHREASQRVPLELAGVPNEEVDKIAKVSIVENKALARRIAGWRDLRANPDGKPIKNALQMETALIGFVMKCPHKILFRRAEDGQMLAWYVTSIQWHKLVKRKYRDRVEISPAHTVMHLEAFQDESSKSTSYTWEDPHPFDGAGDFNGETVSELLEKSELVPEKSKSYESYLAELTRFHDLYKKTGAQFNAFGRCYGDTSDDWDYSPRRKGKKSKRSDGLRSLTKDGLPSRVVIDPNGDESPDEEDDTSVAEGTTDSTFWVKFDALAASGNEEQIEAAKGERNAKPKVIVSDDDCDGSDEEETEDNTSTDDEEEHKVVLPVHPYLQVFDFASDSFVTCHVNCLHEYKFAAGIEKKLILPASTKKLVAVLIGTAKEVREDIISGKTGGVIVMSTGEPGTGKTLTAEVFAEQMEIPLYIVQCSQLGTSSGNLEEKLIMVLKRAMRWNALLLLDEADVYTRQRENDIEQNAIVGVFLRLLERFRGVLFMTSNRATAIDDAILSRCIAHIRYQLPDPDQSALIWEVLAENYGINLFPKEIKRLCEQFPLISGRNIKTLLKLATSVSKKEEYKKGEIGELIREMAAFVDFPKAHYNAIKEKK